MKNISFKIKMIFISKKTILFMKVTIIGTGRVGSTLGFLLAGNDKIDQLVLVNRTKKKANALKMVNGIAVKFFPCRLKTHFQQMPGHIRAGWALLGNHNKSHFSALVFFA